MLYVVTTDPDGNTHRTPTLHHDRQVAVHWGEPGNWHIYGLGVNRPIAQDKADILTAVYGYTTRIAPITNRIAKKEDRPWPAT